MTRATLKLTQCDHEPIRYPAAIQPHGMLIVADRATHVVQHVAGPIEQHLTINDWRGAPLLRLIGAKLTAAISANAAAGYLGQIQSASGETLDASLRLADKHILVELEPSGADTVLPAVKMGQMEGFVAAFEHAADLTVLCDKAAAAFRCLTGFDRVMVYHFLDDASGVVMAESRSDDQHSFLYHHFPESDIPRQARELYLRNPTRAIPDSSYTPAPLRPAWDEAQPLDMGDCSLRSVSPIHLQYLKNMGVAASASISIVQDGRLWGIIACHHETPRLMTYEVRASCRVLAAILARQIKAKEEIKTDRQRIRIRGVADDILQRLPLDGSLNEAISNHIQAMGAMMEADGIAVLRRSEIIASGVRPGDDDLRQLAAWLLPQAGTTAFATHRLDQLYSPPSRYREQVSGVLAITLSAEELWQIIWFRSEQTDVVKWAGNPHEATKQGTAGTLPPRASFDTWQETLHGRARRWTLPEVEAADHLRKQIMEIAQSQRIRDLNHRLREILHDHETLLEQKDFLIKEVNHRVQNSLQLVSSFLLLQGRDSDDEKLNTALEEARRRLGAVALVHRLLYRGNQVQLVDMARYIDELCCDMIASMGHEWSQHVSLDVASILIPTDRAVTVGLVLTELLININKYAYGGQAGPIQIRLTQDHTDFRLVVADHGVGRLSTGKGFGSRMIEVLVAQLGGTLHHSDNHPGMSITLVAPTETPAPHQAARKSG